MRPLTVAMTGFIFILLSGCATVRVNQDYDLQANFAPSGSWQWRDPLQTPTGDIRSDNPLLNRRIRQAVTKHLQGRNIRYASTDPDYFLAYHLAIGSRIQSDTYHTTVGVGRYHYPWYGGMGTETRIRQYDEGRLTIDIHGADTGGLLWRGVGTYRFKSYKTPQDAEIAIQKIVDKILSQFPPN